MRRDSRGNPDVCRETYTPMTEEARRQMNKIKLDINQLIEECKIMFGRNDSHEVKRLLAMGISELEVGAALIVKAIALEDFDTPAKDKEKDWPR